MTPCYSKPKINYRIFVKEREQHFEDLLEENKKNIKRLSKQDKEKLESSSHVSAAIKLLKVLT